MTIATGARHNLSYKVESVYGTSPTGPYQAIRHTGTTLGLSKDAIESEELREDRQVAHFRHGTKSVGGDINFELSYGSFDDLLEATLCGTWALGVDEFGDPAPAGVDTLEPGSTARSFTIERHFGDIDQAMKMSGCQFNSMSLSVAPNSMVTGSFSLLGKDMATITATETATSAANANQPFDGFTGSITEGGSSIAVVTALELTIENGMEPSYVVGDDTSLQSPLGKSTVNGSITAYFEDPTLINKFINETSSTLEFVLQDLDGNQYTFGLPNVKYNSGNPETSGPGQITVTLDFVGLYDSTVGSQLYIKRDPA
jgi:hypothetical protein